MPKWINYLLPAVLMGLSHSVLANEHAEKPVAKDPPEKSHEKVRTQTPVKIAVVKKDLLPTPGLVDEAAIADIQRARDEIEAQKKKLAARETELNLREKNLQEELSKLTELRDSIHKEEMKQKLEHEEKVSKLVETLIAMSPKASAKMIGTLDEELAVDALSRMESDRLAKILNIMEPTRSSRLSELMAGINRPRRSPLKRAERPTEVARNEIRKGGTKNDGIDRTQENTLTRKSPTEKTEKPN